MHLTIASCSALMKLLFSGFSIKRFPMFRLLSIFSLLLLCASSFAQQGPRVRGDHPGGPQQNRGLVTPPVEILPVTWGSLQDADGAGATFSVDRTATFFGATYQNYQVGLNAYDYYINAYYSYPGITRNRMLYVFDTAGLSTAFGYELSGTMSNFGNPFARTVEVFDAEDFGLQNGSPFPTDGSTALAANGAGTPIGTFSATDTAATFSVNVTNAVWGDLAANNTFTGFVVGLAEPEPQTTGFFWGFFNVGLNTTVAPVPTLGEWGLIAFVLMLMSVAVVYSIRQRKAKQLA
jgi:hypothetical protein